MTQRTLKDNTQDPDKAFLRFLRAIPARDNAQDQSLTQWVPEAPKVQQTYTQDWKAYDEAKTNEDSLFKQLLIELALSNQEEVEKKPGRTGYHTWEKVLAMCLKEYYHADLRQTESILKSLVASKHIPRAPGYGSIKNFYNDEKLTELLDRLILISALPLSTVETTGAIDSTGYSLYQYQQWSEYKWGKTQGKERVWRKLHAWGGTRTNIFIAAKITKKNTGDAPMLKEVIGNTPQYFNMQEFVADKAYSSRKILQFLSDIGMTPFIPFKKNVSLSSPAKRCPTWKDMLYEFHHRQDEFMDTYHQRSNIETNFHMLKTNFGNKLATKNFVANKNELLARILCHNICVLIQEMHEPHITIDFNACEKMMDPVKK